MAMYRRGSRHKGYFKKNNNKVIRTLKICYVQYENKKFELIEPDYSKLKSSFVNASKIKVSALF